MGEKTLKVLFVGNSHTYVNDMPLMFKEEAKRAGVDCDVVMIAHGGWHLDQHVREPDVRFNIKYGGYDFVILQEYAQPFGGLERMAAPIRTLCEWARGASCDPVLYMTWAQKTEPEKQEEMSNAYLACAKETGAWVAPVGQVWWQYKKDHPEVELYAPDGGHASPAGSRLAAQVLWKTIQQHPTLRR